MTKHKVDMGSYDESKTGGGYGGAEPTRGIYKAALVSVADHESKQGNEGLEWKFEIKDGEFAGWRGYVYSDLGNSLWKTQQIVHSITGNADKDVTLDTDDDGAKMAKKAKPVMIRVVQEKYEGEPRAKIRVVMPLVDPAGAEDEGDESDPFA